jgi:phosphoenolpyruvate carboxykinase (GTP)
MADYWSHWIRIGTLTEQSKLPRIYSVNWFRKDVNGKFLWPGFGENARVLDWIIRRIEGTAKSLDTPIGRIPYPGQIQLEGSSVTEEKMTELFAIDKSSWMVEADLTETYFNKFGDRVPPQLKEQLANMRNRLK